MMPFFRQYGVETPEEITELEARVKLQSEYRKEFDVVAWMKENPGCSALHTVSAYYWWDN